MSVFIGLWAKAILKKYADEPSMSIYKSGKMRRRFLLLLPYSCSVFAILAILLPNLFKEGLAGKIKYLSN